MHCAHCNHQMRYIDWFQFRWDNSYRCRSCKNVFYVEEKAIRKRVPIVTGLLFAAAYLGFLYLASSGIINGWIAILYWIAWYPLGTLVMALALEDAPTIAIRPMRHIRRKKWFTAGMIACLAAILAAFVARRFGADDEVADSIEVTGGIVWAICAFVGRHLDSQPRANAK